MELDFQSIITKLKRQHVCNLDDLVNACQTNTEQTYFEYPRTLFKQHIFEQFRLYTLAALEQNSDINIGRFRFFLS